MMNYESVITSLLKPRQGRSLIYFMNIDFIRTNDMLCDMSEDSIEVIPFHKYERTFRSRHMLSFVRYE